MFPTTMTSGNVVASDLFTVDPETGKAQLRLHAGQQKAWESKKRFVMVEAGTQGGKCGRFHVLLSDGTRKFVRDVRPMDEVYCLEESTGRIVKSRVTANFWNGRQGNYRVTTESGREIIVTAEHPFLTHGMTWRLCKDISIGTKVAVPSRLPEGQGWCDPNEARVMGYLFGDGCLRSGGVKFSNAKTEILDDLRESLPEQCRLLYLRNYDYHISGRGSGASFDNPVIDWCRKWEVYGVLSKNKVIPEFVFRLQNKCLAPFLNALFACDAHASLLNGFSYCTASKQLARDVQHLLLRFAIMGRISPRTNRLNGKIFHSWNVIITDRISVARLASEIGVTSKQSGLEGFLANPKNGVGGWNKRVRENVKDDIFWDTVVDITNIGEDDVFDITVDGYHNFIADDFYGHNTSFGPWWLWRAIKRSATPNGPNDYLAVTSTFPLLDRKMLPEFLRVFQTTLKLGRWWDAKKIFELANPETGKLAARSSEPMWGRVIFGSAKNADSLEAATAKAAWLDECGMDSFGVSSWEAVLRRLSLSRGPVLLSSTLYNFGWMKQLLHDPCIRGERDDVEIVSFESIMNPLFPQAEFERARRDLPRWKFDMQYRGIYSRPAGMIYDSFNEEFCTLPTNHELVRDGIPATWPIYVGVDFGGVNMAALFTAENPENGALYHFNEYLMGEKSIKQHAEAFKKIVGNRPLMWVGGAKPEDQWRYEFRQHGIPLVPPPISEVEVGISRVYAYHKNNRIYVFPHLKKYLDEKGRYSRKLDELNQPTEDIENKNDYHLMDAERVMVAAVHQLRNRIGNEIMPLLSQAYQSRWAVARAVAQPLGYNGTSRVQRGRKW